MNNIKVAIFDFDDTLAIHKDKDYSKKRENDEEYYLNYYLNAYLNPLDFYEKIELCKINPSILKLIKILEKRNVKIYCVTGMRFSFHFKAKENFVHKYYSNNIEVISCKDQKLKIDAIKIIKRINNCNLNEILFVDDLEENIKRFNNIGINALLAHEVENFMEGKNEEN